MKYNYCVSNLSDSWRLNNTLVIYPATNGFYVIVTVVPVLLESVFIVHTRME